MISAFINLTIASLVTTQFIKFLNLSENNLKETWENILNECNLRNVKNKSGQYFKIKKAYEREYGYECLIPFVPGLTFTDLENIRPLMEDNLKASIEFENTDNCFIARIITNRQENEGFVPVKTDSDQLFLGYKEAGLPYLLDMNLNPHILVGGMTGTGKSVLIAQILTNLIYNNSKDIEIYLGQIRKSDNDIFKDCNGVRFSASNVNEISTMLKRIDKIAVDREKMFSFLGVKNIKQYNSRVKKSKNKLKRIYILIDELSFFMPSKLDADGDDSLYKEECWEYILNIVKAGRSAGIHFISATQRSTAANLDPNVKAQLTRITFKQGSLIDSQNIINTNDAIDLKDRQLIVCGNEYLKLNTTEIDSDMLQLKEYVPELNILERTASIDDLIDKYKSRRDQPLNNTMTLVSKEHQVIQTNKEDVNVISINKKTQNNRKNRRKKVNE